MHRVSALGLFAAVVMTGGCTTASEQASLSASSLSSDAAEGSRLADQIARGRSGPVFVRAHAQELQEDVNRIQKSLADESPPGTERLLRLADQTERALSQMVIHPADTSAARKNRKTLEHLSAEIARVEE